VRAWTPGAATPTPSRIISCFPLRRFRSRLPPFLTVLLHGLNGHSSHGSNLATAHHLLNNGFHVVALDMEGHGRSSGLRGFLPSIEGAVAGDVLALLLRTRARYPTLPLFLMGNSMGGLSATLVALAVQDSIGVDAQFLSGVVLQCPLIRFSSEPSPLLQTLVRVLAAVMPQLPFLPHRPGSQSVLQRKVRAAMEADSFTYTGRCRAGTALALHRAAALAAGRLAEVAIPFLVQHGTADALVAHHGSQALIKQAAAKDKTLISYQNAGHNLLNEEPETLAQVRLDYLRWLDERVEASAMSAAL